LDLSNISLANGRKYQRALAALHRDLRPEWYLEVGCFKGNTLTLAEGNVIGVDPNFKLEKDVVKGREQCLLYQMESDTFFDRKILKKLGVKPDFAFLDGMHLFEFLLRDFINTEEAADRSTVVALHDCCPRNVEMAARDRSTRDWAGDVWKVLVILLRERPDLDIKVYDARPTGLVVVSNLNPKSKTLRKKYDDLVEEFTNVDLDAFGLENFYSLFEFSSAEDLIFPGAATAPDSPTSAYQLDPQKPLVADIDILKSALVVPVRLDANGKSVGLGGVLDSNGDFSAKSLTFIEPHRQVNARPDFWEDSDIDFRPGTWLFGGKHDLRFGHFLVETTSRLWALDHIDTKVEGIIFLPERLPAPKGPAQRLDRTQAYLDLFAPLPPAEILVRPTRFERLIVPPQGCGAGTLAPGIPEHRLFVRNRLVQDPRSAGPKKIYISRTGLANSPGQILFERDIETAFKADGFEIFHPQDHPLREQVAAYGAAEIVVGVEGSAFHLVAYAAHATTRVGVIRRRQTAISQGIVDQLSTCLAGPAIALEAIAESFHVPGTSKMSNAVLDFQELGRQLRASGLVSSSFHLPKRSATEMVQEKTSFADSLLR
jgi:hypothetical protein